MATSINLYILTYNCAKALLDTNAFSYYLFSALTSQQPPDLLVLSLQEISPLPFAFIGGSYLSPYLSRFYEAVKKSTNYLGSENYSSTYVPIITHNVGPTCLIVFAKNSSAISDVETAGIGTGLWGIGNKGAVGVRLRYHSTTFTFVALHLAASEHNLRKRNENWESIVRGLVFPSPATNKTGEEVPLLFNTSKDISMYKSTSHLFVAGDLNYRTSLHTPTKQDFLHAFPRPNKSLEHKNHFSTLFKLDQLNEQRIAGKTCHGLIEAKINFPPTYKYRITKKTVETIDDQAEEWHWAAERWPSWCDRILYMNLPVWLKNQHPTAQINPLKYDALPLLPNSDHRPVALEIEIPLLEIPEPGYDEASNDPRVTPPFEINPSSKTRRMRVRRLEIFVGCILWLTSSWEGGLSLGVLACITGIVLILRSYFP